MSDASFRKNTTGPKTNAINQYICSADQHQKILLEPQMANLLSREICLSTGRAEHSDSASSVVTKIFSLIPIFLQCLHCESYLKTLLNCFSISYVKRILQNVKKHP